MGDRPLDRHRAEAPGVLSKGDPDEIKRLYVELGEDLWEAHSGADAEAPLLSLPQTHPVVAAELKGTTGLVLDAGCGPNPALSTALARSGERTLVALDIGYGTVRVAREVAREEGIELLAVVADVEALPFRDGAFDAVVSDDTIEHLPDDLTGVSELARVVRDDAPVVLATPNRHSARVVSAKLRDLLRGRRRPASDYYASNSHLREYTWRQLERLAAPWLEVARRVSVPVAERSWRSRLLNRALGLGPLHRVSPMIVLVTFKRRGARPRRPRADERADG